MSRDIRAMFGTSAPKPAAPTTPSAKGGAISKRHALVNAFGPITTDGYALPQQFQTLLSSQPDPEPRCAWPIPGVLAFGCQLSDRLSPAEWLKERKIRVVIDLSPVTIDRVALLKDTDDANAVLISIPVNMRLELGPSDISAFVTHFRVLNRLISAAREAEHPFRIYVCDSVGGGVAAFVVIMIMMQQYGGSLEDARIYTTRCFREHSSSLVPIKMRVFPDGDALKRASQKIATRLKERVITTTAVIPEHIQEVLDAHGVHFLGRIAVMLCDLDPAIVSSKLAFSRDQPLRMIVWVTISVPPKARHVFERESSFPKRQRRNDDGDDD